MTSGTNGGSGTTLTKWVLALFSAVILLLLALAFQATAENTDRNARQDLQILRLQFSDSLNVRQLERIEKRLDEIWALVRVR